jgi:hypothetical protein
MKSRQSAVGEIAKKTKTLLNNQTAKPQPLEESATDSNGLREHIAARAYGLYEERGFRQGCDLQDWLDAEREILSRQQPA